MIFEGSHKVIAAIKEKKRLQDAGQPHDHIRPLLYQGGGFMCGTYGVGAALALEEMGYRNCFSYIVGVSSGAPTAGHFAAGSILQGAALVSEECCRPGFVNLWRFWNQVDAQHFMEVLRTDPQKGISVERAMQNPAELYFGVTEYKTAAPQLLAPKNEEHFFMSMYASINMQNVSPHQVIIDGTHYTDGGFSSPHVIGKTVAQLQPTHALIVTNNNREFSPVSPVERFLNNFVFRLRLNGVLAQAINTRGVARDEAIAAVLESDVEAAVVWGDSSIGSVEFNVEKVMSVMEASRTWWHGLFALETD